MAEDSVPNSFFRDAGRKNHHYLECLRSLWWGEERANHTLVLTGFPLEMTHVIYVSLAKANQCMLNFKGKCISSMCLAGSEQQMSVSSSKNTNHILRVRKVCEVVDGTRTLQTDAPIFENSVAYQLGDLCQETSSIEQH